MSGSLGHSPADIIRWLIIGLSYGTDPDDDLTWPIYCASEPTAPDNCMTVYDTTAIDQGRRSFGGRRELFYGFQIRVRATDHETGWVKANNVATGLDASVLRNSVTIGGNTYCVHSINRDGGVIALGRDVANTKRRLFTINGVADITQL